MCLPHSGLFERGFPQESVLPHVSVPPKFHSGEPEDSSVSEEQPGLPTTSGVSFSFSVKQLLCYCITGSLVLSDMTVMKISGLGEGENGVGEKTTLWIYY